MENDTGRYHNGRQIFHRFGVIGGHIEYDTHQIQVSSSDITTIRIYSEHEDNIYYLGEDAILKAEFENPSSVLYVTWHKEENGIKHAIDTVNNNSKYKGTSCRLNIEEQLLMIRKCDHFDAGTYTLVVSCKGVDIYSNKLDLDIVKGPPKVTLHKVPSALLNEDIELKATIRGFPKQYTVIWMKSNQKINTADLKYKGSMNKDDTSVLCIKNVEMGDVGEYTITVNNKYGEGTSTEKLEVFRVSQMFTVSGSVVVSPSETITFQTNLSNRDLLKIQWWKIKDQSLKEIKIDSKKYFYIHGDNIHIFEIIHPETEDIATYYFTSEGMTSNKITVHVDDSEEYSTAGQSNCLRLFALQKVSAEALREVFQRLPGTFVAKVDQLKQKCRSSPPKQWKNELLTYLGNVKSLKDVDISLLYRMLRNSIKETPVEGWGKSPNQNNISTADDIERIHQSRNFISHTDASDIETNEFNNKSLDLLGAIQRLSKDNVRLRQNSFRIMNNVYTPAENIIMQEKLKIFREAEKRLDHIFLNIDIDGGSQGMTRSIQNENIGFHSVCTAGIYFLSNGTQAAPRKLYTQELCFMNRPMIKGEKVYLCGKHNEHTVHNHRSHAFLRIGLTNIDPYELTPRQTNIELKKVTCIQEKNGVIANDFQLCITLSQSSAQCTLLIHKTREYHYTYQMASILQPLWLAIEPYGIKSIELKNTPIEDN